MSNSELFSALQELLELSAYHYMNFVTALFALLLAGYLVGPKLTKLMTALIIGSFSLHSFLAATASWQAITLAQAVGLQFHQVDASDVRVRAIADAAPPVWLLEVYPETVVGTLLLSYLAGIVFFFHARSQPHGGGISVLP